MLSNKYFIYISIAAFVLLSAVQIEAVQTFSRDQYAGSWYVHRIMTPMTKCNPIIECSKMQVWARGITEWKFTQISSQWKNMVFEKKEILGKVLNSKIHLKMDPHAKDAVMKVTRINDGELILLGDENKLITRHRVPTLEATRKFRKIAKHQNMTILNVSFDRC